MLLLFIVVICRILQLVDCALLQEPILPPQPSNPEKPIYPSLLDATLEELINGLENNIFTSVDLVNAYLTRIDEVNHALRAVNEINPDALSIAKDLDLARDNGKISGPLHGIPVLIKDNIATNDKLNNTAGSFALLGAKVPEDSAIAAKLRKAGVIILGKTNMDEWAGARAMFDGNGWSAYGGRATGAYYKDQDAYGSSTGSGIAASIGLAWAALGTDTSGSIIAPAHKSNVVGIRPTVGLTSRYLVAPISEHQDTVGPLARTVKDAAYLLQTIAGRDARDNYTSAIPFEDTKMPDYVAACNSSALRGKRIGIPRDFIRNVTDTALLQDFEKSLAVLRLAGAELIDPVPIPSLPLYAGSYLRNILLADMSTAVARYLSLLTHNPNNITSVADLQNFTRSDPREDYPAHDTDILDEGLALGYNNSSPEFWPMYTAAQHLAGPLGLSGALANHSLDALVVPMPYSGVLAAVHGSPIINVPMGAYPEGTEVVKSDFGNVIDKAPGIPYGLTFLGERFEEEKLIGIAYAFEQRTMVRTRVRPVVKPKTEIEDVVQGKLRNSI